VNAHLSVKVDIPKDIKVHTLGSGASSQSVFFVAEDDIVYAAGQNYRFQLGLGKIGSEKFPVLVEFDEGPPLHEIVKISSSGTHTVAISCELYTDMPTVSPTIEPSMHPTFEPSVSVSHLKPYVHFDFEDTDINFQLNSLPLFLYSILIAYIEPKRSSNEIDRRTYPIAYRITVRFSLFHFAYEYIFCVQI